MHEQSFAAQFDEEHSDQQHGKYILHKGWIYYPDGARREARAMGLCLEPPTDKFERAKAIALYHKLRLERALDAFFEVKEHYKSLADSCLRDGYCFGEEEEAVEKLTAMQRDITVLRKKFAAASKAVEDAKPTALTLEQRLMAANRRDAAKSLATIKKIRA